MKKRILITVMSVIVLSVCVLGAKKIFFSKENNEPAKPIKNNIISQLRYTVTKDYIESTVEMTGTVTNHNEEETVKIEGEVLYNAKTEIFCKVYDDVKKDDVLFKIGGKEYKSTVDGKVKGILNENNTVSVAVIDYGRLFIDAEVNYKLTDKMPAGSKVSVKESNPLASGEIFEEEILGFGFEVKENLMEVYFSNSKNFLPGTQVKIEYKYLNETESCYILKQMLLKDTGGYYVNVEKNGEREKRKVTVGQEFSSWNNEIKTEFVEIIDGLEEGEKIVIDIIE